MKKIRFVAALIFTLAILGAAVFSAGAQNKYPTAHINSTDVNVRAGAGTSFEILDNLSKGAKVTMFGGLLYNDEWRKVKTAGGKVGYIYKDYVKIDDNQLFIPATANGYTGYAMKFYSMVNTTGHTATWTTSDKKTATVSSAGKVTCHKAGKVTITAIAGSKSVSSTVTITDAVVTMEKTSREIYLDDEPVNVGAVCKKPLTYTSSNENVAKVSDSGLVTPVAAGTAKITALSKSGSKAVCTFTVKKREIIFNLSKSTLYKGCYAVFNPTGGKEPYKYFSKDKSIITVDSTGLVKAVGAGTAKVVVKSGTLRKVKTFTVKSGKSVSISHDTAKVNLGMTFYCKGYTDSIKWTTSDSSIATVDGGFITTHKKGRAIISATTSSGCHDCIVTVTAAEPVRFAYTSENSVIPGSKVQLHAITDKKRAAVEFKLTYPNGKSAWVKDAAKSSVDGHLLWTGEKSFSVSGVYTLEAYSKTSSGNFVTCSGGKTTFFVGEVKNYTDTSFCERRISTKALRNIAAFEGFLSKVSPDELVADSPTVGYGRVVYAGTSFYNGLTKDEAFAYLVKTINDSAYTSQVNKFLTKYNIKFNQAHFDALVDFSYNLGPYFIENDSDLTGVLTSCYGKASYKYTAYTCEPTVSFRKEASDDGKLIKRLSPHTVVTLVSTKLYNKKWVNVKLSNGTEGYVLRSEIIRRTTSDSVRDLRNVSYSKMMSKVLPLHHASGTCYWGLLYRRMDEIELFFFNDYDNDGSQNTFNMTYHCSKNPSFGVPE